MNLDVAAVVNSRPWFERALGAIAPEWELRRLQARVQRHLFSYQAAQADRLFSPKTYAQPSESPQTARDRATMMFEARDLVENFGPAKVALNKYAENIAPTEYSPATNDRDYDKLIADYFHSWCKKCDFEGRHSFRKLVEIAVQTRPVDGDCGLVLRRMGDGGLKVQLVAGDRIGNPQESQSISDNYFSGVTVDQYGRPLSYRLFRLNRFGMYETPEEIAAGDFFHLLDPFRADQYRGVTDFHAVLRTARMLKNILDAEQVGVNFASQQAALVFNDFAAATPRNVFTPANAATMADGNQQKNELSEIGAIRYFGKTDKVEVMPSRPGSAFQGFTALLMDHFALGIGVSSGVLFGTQDYKGPSVRAEFAQADRTFSRHKGVLTDKILEPTKEAVLLNGIAIGDVPPPPKEAGETVVQALRRAMRGTWRFPAKLTIDVGRESDAKINENMTGLRSAQEIAAEENADAFERLEQNAQVAAEVKRLAEKYDVPETTIRLVGKVLPSTPAAAAAAGEKAGDAAAEAQAASVARTAEPAGDAPKAEPAEPDEDDGEDTVAGRLARPQRNRQRALSSLLTRAERLHRIRDRIGGQVSQASDLKSSLSRIGYVAPKPEPKPEPAPAPELVEIDEVKTALRARLDTDAKLAALAANLKNRKARLTAAELAAK
jgi:capsid protein